MDNGYSWRDKSYTSLSEVAAVHGCQIGCPSPGAIQDHQLMFDEQCLRDDGSRPTRSQQSGQGGQKCTRSTKRSRVGSDRTVIAWVYKSMK